MTTAEKGGQFVERGADRRDGVERRKSPRISMEETERRHVQRRIEDDRRQG